MQFAALVLSLFCFQESPAAAQAAGLTVSSEKPVRIEVSLHSFRHDVELSKQQQLNIDEFLTNPKVKVQRFWSNEFVATTLTGSELSISLGENRPVVTGIHIGANGGRTPTLTRQQTGSKLKVTPKLKDDGRIQARLSIEASRVDEDNPAVELPEKRMQTGITEVQHSSTILTVSGQTEVMVIKEDDTTNPEKSRMYVIVFKATTLD